MNLSRFYWKGPSRKIRIKKVQVLYLAVGTAAGNQIGKDAHLPRPPESLKRSVKNNLRRFPSDFMYELTKEEWDF